MIQKDTLLKKILYWGFLADNKVNNYQKTIRTTEWEAIESYIKNGTKFLDVGCGSGFLLSKVKNLKNCEAIGIDPKPNVAGVKEQSDHWKIVKGNAEEIPFENNRFDTVYSSHVLEHVEDINQSLIEFKRVLKDDGTVIILVPTATLAWISLISNIIFTPHLRILRFFGRPLIKSDRTRFIHMFIPYSHGKEDKTVLYDLKHYKIKNWKKIIQEQFEIQETLLPLLFPFPDYIQLFKARKSKKYSSSVAFICKKK